MTEEEKPKTPTYEPDPDPKPEQTDEEKHIQETEDKFHAEILEEDVQEEQVIDW